MSPRVKSTVFQAGSNLKKAVNKANKAFDPTHAKAVRTHGEELGKALDAIRPYFEARGKANSGADQAFTVESGLSGFKVVFDGQPPVDLNALSLRRKDGTFGLYARAPVPSRDPYARNVAEKLLDPTKLAEHFPAGTVDAERLKYTVASLFNDMADRRGASKLLPHTDHAIAIAGARLKKVLDAIPTRTRDIESAWEGAKGSIQWFNSQLPSLRKQSLEQLRSHPEVEVPVKEGLITLKDLEANVTHLGYRVNEKTSEVVLTARRKGSDESEVLAFDQSPFLAAKTVPKDLDATLISVIDYLSRMITPIVRR